AVDVVAIGARVVAEAPAFIAQYRLDHRDADHVLQLLEPAPDQRARSPRADQRHVQMVAAGLGGESAIAGRTRAAVWRDPAAEARGLADESALLVLCLHRLPVDRPFPVHEHVVSPSVESSIAMPHGSLIVVARPPSETGAS